MRIQTLLLFFCLAASGAFGQDVQSSSKNWIEAMHADAQTIARNAEIVKNTKGTDGVFVVRDDGTIRHVQSGLVCPAKFPNVAFWHAELFDSPLGPGMDVGCDYGRNGADG